MHLRLLPAPLLIATLASPAFALDCNKARAPIDKAICASPEAGAADDAMSKAYQSLAAGAAESDKKMLLEQQRTWLKTRTDQCTGTDVSVVACVIEETKKRTAYLSATPLSGPGVAGKLMPVIIATPPRKGTTQIDVGILKFAAPRTAGERLFNKEVDKLLKDMPAGKNDDFGSDMIYSFDVSMVLAYAAPGFVSARAETYMFSGGAHGNDGVTNINVDLERAKVLDFDDVFATGAKPKLEAACLAQVETEKHARLPDDTIEVDAEKELRSAIASGLGDLAQWSFATGEANVTYDAYALGSYAEGAYSCSFKSDFLRPLAQPGFAIP